MSLLQAKSSTWSSSGKLDPSQPQDPTRTGTCYKGRQEIILSCCLNGAICSRGLPTPPRSSEVWSSSFGFLGALSDSPSPIHLRFDCLNVRAVLPWVPLQSDHLCWKWISSCQVWASFPWISLVSDPKFWTCEVLEFAILSWSLVRPLAWCLLVQSGLGPVVLGSVFSFLFSIICIFLMNKPIFGSGDINCSRWANR